MYVKDYMSDDLITITPDTTLIKAHDLMKSHDINRLPVVTEGSLVGLVTQQLLAKNLPSSSTSLSAHEVNYLLEKTQVKDIMDKHYLTCQPDSLLEQAAMQMRTNNVGALLVIQDEELKGIITEKDIFKAFVELQGFGQPGKTFVVELSEDRSGVIKEIGTILYNQQLNVTNMVVYQNEIIRILIHVDSTPSKENIEAFKDAGYLVKLIA